jgi:site-specific DNA-methyltransferase (adenine-specific)/modification methylase
VCDECFEEDMNEVFMETNKIYNENCLETMKRMPDNSVNCVITSPPYNMRLRIRNGEYTQREFGANFSKKYKEFGDAMPMEEYYKFHSEVLKELLRISPIVFWNIQIVTGSKEAIFKIIGDFAKEITDIIIWDKGFGQPAINEGVLNSAYEMIIILEKERKNGRKFNQFYFPRGTVQNIWRLGRGGKGEETTHTAVFPIELVTDILKSWTKEGDLIYDPFMGTGTTGVGCQMLKREYIGSEISTEYTKLAEQRIKSISNTLF